MAVLNYTTRVDALRTIGEIQALLAKQGATRIATEYADGTPIGVAFGLKTPHGERFFELPVDVAAMQRLLAKNSPNGGMSVSAFRSREHAERVAWRVVKDWLEAQLTLVQTQMAAIDQVLLPYLRVDEHRTLYAAYVERENVLALERA